MARWLLRIIFSRFEGIATPFRVVFADGSDLKNYTSGEPELTIRFNTRGAEWYTLIFFYDGLFEKYIEGKIDLIGNHPVMLLYGIKNDFAKGKVNRKPFTYSPNPFMYVRKRIQEWLQSNKTKAIAKRNAEFHYAIHPKLFEEMLGDTVGYSEGYWTAETKNLNQAKHNNYEYICRKLLLKPGDRVLEVGSGWGFMPIYMAKKYGALVTVYNPVGRQNDYMRERFKKHGVADKIRLVEGDHRDILKEEKHSYDKFVTIGVHEHHGMKKRRYDEWWESIEHVLKPGGVGVISTSSRLQWTATSFLVLKYIFPGGHLPSLPHDLLSMARKGMMLVEVENLWPHYQRTLVEWRNRFHERWSRIQPADPTFFTERFRRLWSMYLEGTVATFNDTLDLTHIVFTNGRSADYYPRTREAKHAGDFRTGEEGVECYGKEEEAVSVVSPLSPIFTSPLH